MRMIFVMDRELKNKGFDIVKEGTSVVLNEYRGHQRKLVVPDSVAVIGSHAFRRCLSLEEIEIPGSVLVIDAEAFNGCHGLRRIQFHEGLIESEAVRSGTVLPSARSASLPV